MARPAATSSEQSARRARESAQAALTLMKSRAASLGTDPALFQKNDIHIHVLADAIPKDGPSAGVAPVHGALVAADRPEGPERQGDDGRDLSRGLVLPVGGIKEKVVAAAAAGLTRVMLPARNLRDYGRHPKPGA